MMTIVIITKHHTVVPVRVIWNFLKTIAEETQMKVNKKKGKFPTPRCFFVLTKHVKKMPHFAIKLMKALLCKKFLEGKFIIYIQGGLNSISQIYRSCWYY
jgi:hypothetical protein